MNVEEIKDQILSVLLYNTQKNPNIWKDHDDLFSDTTTHYYKYDVNGNYFKIKLELDDDMNLISTTLVIKADHLDDNQYIFAGKYDDPSKLWEVAKEIYNNNNYVSKTTSQLKKVLSSIDKPAIRKMKIGKFFKNDKNE